MKTGFIGLGAMGYSMARNLHQAGLLAGVYNRNPVKGASFCQQVGAPAFRSMAELTQHCEALVLCVSADADVLAVIDEIAGALPDGGLVIDCSTVSRDTAKQAAAKLALHDCSFLDAPVSGGTEGAKNGTLSIMVGGEQKDFERARPLFDAMGSRAILMGPVGAGQATKAVNQVMAAGINQAVTEAMAFAESLQLPIEQLVEVVGNGAAGNWFVNHRGVTMVKGEYPPGFKLALHLKDLKICAQMAHDAGVKLPLSSNTIDDYQQLLEQGHGDEDISALYRLKSKS
ncbi:MAG: NAD(P)-dependent oxidoreductase [Nevskiales bacterium]